MGEVSLMKIANRAHPSHIRARDGQAVKKYWGREHERDCFR